MTRKQKVEVREMETKNLSRTLKLVKFARFSPLTNHSRAVSFRRGVFVLAREILCPPEERIMR